MLSIERIVELIEADLTNLEWGYPIFEVREMLTIRVSILAQVLSDDLPAGIKERLDYFKIVY